MKRELAWSHLSQQIHLFEDDVGDKGGRAGIYLRFCEQMSQVASTTPCIFPFLIMFIISYPCNVRQAVSNEKKPIPGFVNRLMRAMVLFDQVVEVFHLPQFHALRKNPSSFEISNGFGIGSVFVDIDHTMSRC